MCRVRIISAIFALFISAPAWAVCEPGNFTVAVDSGHTPGDPGSTSARGKTEYAFNDRLARETLTALQSAGFGKAFMINPYRKDLSLHERTKLSDGRSANLFLSIHHDSVQPHYLSSWKYKGTTEKYADQFSGFSLWVSGSTRGAAVAQAAATAIGTGLLRRGLKPTLHHAEPIAGESRQVLDSTRGIYRRDSLAVLRTSQAPAVLVEAGVIVNRAEEALLELPAHRAKIVAAMVEGVGAACKGG